MKAKKNKKCGLIFMDELFTTEIAKCAKQKNSQFKFYADFNILHF